LTIEGQGDGGSGFGFKDRGIGSRVQGVGVGPVQRRLACDGLVRARLGDGVDVGEEDELAGAAHRVHYLHACTEHGVESMVCRAWGRENMG